MVVRWEELWSDTLSVPALDRLEAALGSLAEADRTLIDLAQAGEPFDTRLEITGPARVLRALGTSPKAIPHTKSKPSARITIESAIPINNFLCFKINILLVLFA